MARYIGSLCKLCRREGFKLYLKGERCYTDKCAIAKRPYAPGQHGKQAKKPTQYGMQLRSKQALKRIYGVLERQFRRYFEEASRKEGNTGENLMRVLETRLDNVVYQMGFAVNRRTARQLVRHGHFLVNGKKVDIPSYRVRPGDVIEVKEKSRSALPIKQGIELAQKANRKLDWIEVDYNAFKGTFLRLPTLDEMDVPVDLQAIIELYSK
ncbi:30S ribosomal protein S4 [Marinitoga sp. 1135]|uniref:Small ribosomal subunit protein uS4 n=1 Tax=Marinitoga piezophila (strain DSM 14283 / JCM 11233 / KA3) TaxID=443254 RepID=H2J777_MARPK|nr:MULTISPECIES: 30S ribosomal protein S4 [Marinitoga]AEX85269.1 ribosomal protein S4, bacterial/organelle type [Marinitoga piezophila KA3]APT75754.1 30S ribosomal protein S4 [Marinitoga sp. 1137]NUU95497.1 30S ribosomal protein S4 [Marinitoga sp. 1135]NUU97424.1 30S ribosomal protein S4 [Marinitoga sp. 1138]